MRSRGLRRPAWLTLTLVSLLMVAFVGGAVSSIARAESGGGGGDCSAQSTKSERWKAEHCKPSDGATTDAGQTPAAGTTTTAGGRTILAGTRPPWEANPHFAQVGMVPTGNSISGKVWLSANHADQLAALARAVSDPASSQYKHFLSHSEYASQFAPTAAQVAAVTKWLRQSGLQVGQAGPDNHYLPFSGTIAAAAAAFGTQFALYDAPGQQVQAPASDLSVPNAVAGLVLSVTGLTPLGHLVKPEDLGPPAAFVNAPPCSKYYGEKLATSLPKFMGKTLPYAPCGYVPSQLRGAYGVSESGLTGAGQTVAITDAFDASTLLADANEYATRHGDPAFAPGQFQDLSAPEGASSNPEPIGTCGGNGWYSEQTLDIEAVHAMAPAAGVRYYGATSCYDDDLMASLARALEDNQASIITNSWGQPTVIANAPDFGCTPEAPCLTITDDIVRADESLFMQGAVQGVGFYFASGDNGDEEQATAFVHPDYPAGDPWVTAVGGTSLGVGKNDQRTFETGWGTAKWVLNETGTDWVDQLPFQYGAGGGYSLLFEQPWYQSGVVTNNPTGGRAVPDIAMDGDPTTGMLIGETQLFALNTTFGPAGAHYGEYRVGGTSLSSPLFAGAQAAAQQGRGSRIGFANPLIYDLYRNFHDEATYFDPSGSEPGVGNIRSDYANGLNLDAGLLFSVRTFNQDSSLTVNHGWDDVTGVGTVTSRYLRRVAAGGE
ncbi:MAG TPA: S53 family peptidase [Gaiellaceae bacterium]|jgi:subtilase family serine protease